jgi:hypothetical protein
LRLRRFAIACVHPFANLITDDTAGHDACDGGDILPGPFAELVADQATCRGTRERPNRLVGSHTRAASTGLGRNDTAKQKAERCRASEYRATFAQDRLHFPCPLFRNSILL